MISSNGLFDPGATSTLEIISTTSSPLTTFPKTECLLSKWRVGASVIKNWLPFVAGPEFAIESIPDLLCERLSLNSSSNLYPGLPDPVPEGSPPWIIKLLITLWNIVPL